MLILSVKYYHPWWSSPDLRALLARWSPVLLICWSLLRRWFCDSLRGLAGTSAALEMGPANKKAKWTMHSHKSFSNILHFIAPRFITFYWALVAGSLSPALHRCWPAVSGTSDHLPDCSKQGKWGKDRIRCSWPSEFYRKVQQMWPDIKKILLFSCQIHVKEHWWHCYIEVYICLIYLVKTGSSQYFFWSPKTWAIFFRKPREKPFLSEPVLKTGALNASVETDRREQRRQIQTPLNNR